MSPDVHALTGAYVLDAVSDLERAEFERHIAECDACAQEVRELRGTAARLGQAASMEPPAWLRSQVLAKITEVRQLPMDIATAPSASARSAGSRWALRLTSAAAALFLVATAVLGVLLANDRSELEDSQSYAQSLTEILRAGDAGVVNGSPNGGKATVVFSRAQGKALVLTENMPPLPESQTYQAWLVGANDEMVSAGLMPRAPSSSLTLDIGQAKGFGVTVEPAGGSPRPTQDPPAMLVDFPV